MAKLMPGIIALIAEYNGIRSRAMTSLAVCASDIDILAVLPIYSSASFRGIPRCRCGTTA